MPLEQEKPSAVFRLKDGWIATLFLIGALLLMIGITRTDVIHYAQQVSLFDFTAFLIALTIPGPILTIWDLPGQLLLWNAVGWCLGLSLFGMASIGATPVAPLILLGFALSFWPRPEGTSIPWLGAGIAAVGGFLICWTLWESAFVEIPFIPA